MRRDFKTEITENFGLALFNPEKSFLLGCQDYFYTIMESISWKPKVILEIGTASGCSAVALLEYAERIITFDVVDIPIRHDIWKFYAVSDRIVSYIIKDTSEIYTLLNKEFDFAFIDGAHTYEGCSRDILVAEKCGRILFHDVDHPPVKRAVDELIKRKGGKYVSVPTFGYWWI